MAKEEVLSFSGREGESAGQEEESSAKKIKIALIIAIAAVILIIIGLSLYYILKEKSQPEDEEFIPEDNSSVKCLADSDCESGFVCIQESCIKQEPIKNVSKPKPTIKPSGSSSGTSGSSGSTGSSGTTTQTTSITNCENDLDCFIKASESCQLAKVNHNYKTELFGAEINKKMYYEIKGDSDKCLFYLKEEDTGKEGNCKIAAKDLSATLKVWKTDGMQVGTFSDDVWKNSTCEGSYFGQD